MRLRVSKSAHSTSYTVIKSAYINKVRTTVTVEYLGNDEQIRQKYHVDDAEAWARAHVDELNRLAKDEKMVYSCLDLYPKTLDELVYATHLSVQKLLPALLQLILKGLVAETGKNNYYRKSQG